MGREEETPIAHRPRPSPAVAPRCLPDAPGRQRFVSASPAVTHPARQEGGRGLAVAHHRGTVPLARRTARGATTAAALPPLADATRTTVRPPRQVQFHASDAKNGSPHPRC